MHAGGPLAKYQEAVNHGLWSHGSQPLGHCGNASATKPVAPVKERAKV